MLRHDAAPNTELPAVEAEFVLADPLRGVALLDLAPARAPDAEARLRRRLEAIRFAERFPGDLPIIHHSLSVADVWRIGAVLDDAFASIPPITLEGHDWIAGLQQALLLNPNGSPIAPGARLTETARSGPHPPAPSIGPDSSPLTRITQASLAASFAGALPRRAQNRAHQAMPGAAPAVGQVPVAEAGASDAPLSKIESGLAPGPSRRAEATAPEAAFRLQAPLSQRGSGRLRGLLLFWVALLLVGVTGATLLQFIGPPSPGPATSSGARTVPMVVAPGRPPDGGAGTASRTGASPSAPEPAQSAEPRNPGPNAPGPNAPGPNLANDAAAPPGTGNSPGSAAISAIDPAPPLPPPPAPPLPRPAALAAPAAGAAPGGSDARAELQRPASEPAADSAAVPMRVFVHHQPANRDQAEALGRRAVGLGAMVEVRAVPATPANREVRYFTRADQPLAERLAGRLGPGWRAQNFTHFQPTPSRGTLEVWLPGWGPEDDGPQ